MDFISPFWTKYFYAYVDYETGKTLRTPQLIALSTRVAGEALTAGRFTQTGLTYKALITSP